MNSSSKSEKNTTGILSSERDGNREFLPVYFVFSTSDTKRLEMLVPFVKKSIRKNRVKETIYIGDEKHASNSKVAPLFGSYVSAQPKNDSKTSTTTTTNTPTSFVLTNPRWGSYYVGSDATLFDVYKKSSPNDTIFVKPVDLNAGGESLDPNPMIVQSKNFTLTFSPEKVLDITDVLADNSKEQVVQTTKTPALGALALGFPELVMLTGSEMGHDVLVVRVVPPSVSATAQKTEHGAMYVLGSARDLLDVWSTPFFAPHIKNQRYNLVDSYLMRLHADPSLPVMICRTLIRKTVKKMEEKEETEEEAILSYADLDVFGIKEIVPHFSILSQSNSDLQVLIPRDPILVEQINQNIVRLVRLSSPKFIQESKSWIVVADAGAAVVDARFNFNNGTLTISPIQGTLMGVVLVKSQNFVCLGFARLEKTDLGPSVLILDTSVSIDK